MNSARNDSDLNNIWEYDPVLFDAITLTDDKKPKYEYEVYFETTNSFEGDNELIFVDDAGDQIWLSVVDNEELNKFDLYHISNDSIIPYAITNESKVGEKFKIVIIYYPGYSEFAGGTLLFKEKRLISMESIAE